MSRLSLQCALLASLLLASPARAGLPLLSPVSVRDRAGAVYSTRAVSSSSFIPPVPGTYQPNFVKVICGYDGSYAEVCYQSYIIKFCSDGTQIDWWTFLGGSGWTSISDIAVDSRGNIWAVGFTTSTDMPLTPDAIQTKPTFGFLFALSPDGRSLVYGSYIGTGDDSLDSLLVGEHDSIYITGRTHSPTFATTGGAYRSAIAPGALELFAIKLDPVASA